LHPLSATKTKLQANKEAIFEGNYINKQVVQEANEISDDSIRVKERK
jgi:hypothetical protein